MSDHPEGTASRPPAVIVGFETNALGISRSLSAEGIRCIGISGPGRHPAHLTNSAEVRMLPEWSESALITALLQIAAELPGRAVLFITKDEPVIWISKNRGALEKHYLLALPDHDTVEMLMSKARFRAYAQQHRWPIPQTWELATEAAVAAAAANLPYPVILKPQIKNSVFRAHCDAKAYFLRSAGELAACYAKVSAWEPEVVIQEWIEGGDEQIAFCLAYFGKDGKADALFAGRKLRQWPIRCGNTAVCERAPAEWTPSLIEMTMKIFTEVGYRGLGSVEYKVHPGTGKVFIIEPTVGRTNYQSEIAVLNGCNIPLAAYCDLAGLAAPRTVRASKPIRLVDGIGDFRAAREYFREGELTRTSWLRERNARRRYMVFRLNDPLPFLKAIASDVAAGLGRK